MHRLRVWLVAATAATLMSSAVAATGQPVHEIQITAARYEFDPATINVTAGEAVRLVIRSKDVVHGFAIPSLKIDAQVPNGGHSIAVEFTAPPAGQYEVACSEFCGSGHGGMRALLVSTDANTPSVTTPPAPADEDLRVDPVEPDFTLIGLPTSLRVPRHKSAFRVTHRFAQPLNADAGDVAGNLFGLDSGAQIGLEYRFGIVRNGEVGIHRTSDRTIEFFSQYGLVRQTSTRLIDVSLLAGVEGTNNFRDQYSPSLGAIVSHHVGERAALYVEPTWVHHADLQLAAQRTGPTDTFMIGVGGRLRIRPTVTLVGEVSPRVAGFRPGVDHGGVGIEKRAGGHVFQLNVSDSFATTLGQIARGGPAARNWYLGFNISRKFY
jgi:cytochrome c oxidase subunit 2